MNNYLIIVSGSYYKGDVATSVYLAEKNDELTKNACLWNFENEHSEIYNVDVQDVIDLHSIEGISAKDVICNYKEWFDEIENHEKSEYERLKKKFG